MQTNMVRRHIRPLSLGSAPPDSAKHIDWTRHIVAICCVHVPPFFHNLRYQNIFKAAISTTMTATCAVMHNMRAKNASTA